jgi:hypothetical protein
MLLGWEAIHTLETTIAKKLDKTDQTTTILGYEKDALLVEGVGKKFLWGPANTDVGTPGVWDLTVHLRHDPARHHEQWRALMDIGDGGTGLPKSPASGSYDDMRAVHDVTHIYPVADAKIDSLFPDDTNPCRTPIGGAVDVDEFIGWPRW